MCALFVGYYAATRLHRIDELRSPRFLLVCAFVLAGGLITGTWEYLSRHRWPWLRTLVTVVAATLFAMWLALQIRRG
jgi:hypothetical protein